MSLFSDIGNAISSAASFVQDAAKVAMDIAPLAFPQLAIAQAVGGLLTQAVGQAVNGAAQQLCKEAGMPKFLQDVIGQVVKDVLSQLQQQGGDKGCQDAAQQHFGGSIGDIIKDLTKQLVDGAKAIMEQGGDDEKCGKGGGKGKPGAANWLVAMAKAMGDSAGAHLKRMVDLSNQIADLTSQGGDKDQQAQNAQKASGLQAEFQAESQLFGMLQGAFSTAIKSIGEGLSQMARKG